MKRIFASIAILLTAFNSSAFALVGGPFDNGQQAKSLDGGSYYQAILNFGNGSGYCFFAPEANIAGDGLNSFPVATRGTQLNRLVMYYKGLTYIGSAFGTVDHETRHVEAVFNGSSTANQTAANTNVGSANSFSSSGAASQGAISTIILSNTVSFTVNGNFTARIYQNAPTLRFRGTGELAFIAPSKADAQAGLAYSGFSGLINAIVTAVGNANVGGLFNPGVFTSAQTAIAAAIGAIPNLTSIDSNYAGAQTRALTVYGSRKYL